MSNEKIRIPTERVSDRPRGNATELTDPVAAAVRDIIMPATMSRQLSTNDDKIVYDDDLDIA
jgi:hypothetical protein